MPITQDLSIFIGQDFIFQVPLSPRQNISDWAFDFVAVTSMQLPASAPTIISPPAWRAPNWQYFWVPQPLVHYFSDTIYKISGNGIIASDPTNGVIQVTISSTDTIGKYPAVYQWQLRRINAGNVAIIKTGTLYTLPVASSWPIVIPVLLSVNDYAIGFDPSVAQNQDLTAVDFGSAIEGSIVDMGGNTFILADDNGQGLEQTILVPPANTEQFSVFFCPPGTAIGNAVYLSGVDTVSPANATSAITAPAIGIVQSLPLSTTCVIQRGGELSAFSSLIPGATYYLDVVSGGITATPPSTSGSGQVVQRLGVPRNMTTLIIDIDRDYTVL